MVHWTGLELTCFDSTGQSFTNGSIYTPDTAEPCRQCVCVNGRVDDCVEVVCDEPPCFNYELIPGTCCGFRCESDIIEDVSIDIDGMSVCF